MQEASMTRIAIRTLVLAVSLALAGCAALPERIEGTNHGADSAPFVAAGVEALEPDAALPRNEALVHRVLLVGDAGVPQESEPVLEALGVWGDAHPERTTVLFLGDNLYPAGLEEDDLPRGEAVLQAQLDASAARKIFVPGNHDWGFPAQGADRVLRQQAYVEAHAAAFLPRDGCAGPAYRELLAADGNDTRGLGLILIDIDPWFVEEAQRPSCPGADTPKALAAQLTTLLERHREQWLIVGAHHPLRTGGPHGGFTRGWLADAVTGTMFLIYGSLQDAYEDGYRAIMAPIEEALASAPPLLFAAGHDHNLQVLEGGGHADFQVVSGAGATDRVRGGHVTDIEGTLFAHGHPGFMALDIERTPGGERAMLYVIETGKARPVLAMELSAP
jgi:hypothetical protein